jgi:hypothetical protein
VEAERCEMCEGEDTAMRGERQVSMRMDTARGGSDAQSNTRHAPVARRSAGDTCKTTGRVIEWEHHTIGRRDAAAPLFNTNPHPQKKSPEKKPATHPPKVLLFGSGSTLANICTNPRAISGTVSCQHTPRARQFADTSYASRIAEVGRGRGRGGGDHQHAKTRKK